MRRGLGLGAAEVRPPLGRAAIALASATLSAVSCASSGPPPPPIHQPPEPPPPEPRLDLGSIPRPVQIVAPEPEAEPPIEIPAEAFAAATLPIVDPSGAMDHFHQRLEAVARGRPGALARIAVYSDSFNGVDLVTSALRQALQARFGDGGKGFVPIAPGWPSQRHQDVDWNHHRDWLTYVVNRGRGPGDRYGLGGVMAYNRTRHATVEGGTMRQWYRARPRLVSGDYTHPTLAGAEVAGDLLHAALLRSFAAELRRSARR